MADSFFRIKIGFGQNYVDSVSLGRRYTAQEARDAGIVQRVASGPDVIADAVQLASKLMARGAYSRENVRRMKRSFYQSVVERAEDPHFKASL